MQQMKAEELPKVKKSIYTRFVKRSLDVCLSGIALLVLSPILLTVSVLELFFHGRPIVFSQERPGMCGKIFNIYKFRSMTDEKDEDGRLLPGDKRITKFGLFLRKTSIDELPELINIFKGDMSIIGPRPLLVEYLPRYSKRHAMRHCVRPGLACPRIKPSNSDTWTWREQFENDIYYIENVSFFMDVRMIVAVAKEAVRGSDYRTNDTRTEFKEENLDEVRGRNEI